MSALSPAPATSSGAPWAHPLTPLDSALTDCYLSYKQNAPVSPLESALPNASHLPDSAHFETTCFDTLASLPPVTPLESALTKTPGGGGSLGTSGQASLSPSYAPRGASIPCGLTRLRILPVTTGVYLRASDLSAFAASPIGSSLCFHKLTNPFSRNSLVFTSIQNPRSGGRAPAVRVSFCSPLVTQHSPLVSGQGRCRTERS